MHINELSKISGIHVETIRSYRMKGLLHPAKLDNGYYDYSLSDYVNLAYIRKLRTFSLSIDDIEDTYNSSIDRQIEVLNKKEESLKDQIEDLYDQLKYIEFEKQHIDESQTSSDSEIIKAQSIDDKIDFYDLDLFNKIEDLPQITKFYRKSTPTILISKEILNGDCQDMMIPLQIGVGSYRYIFEQNHLNIPEKNNIVPNGIYLSQVLILDNLKEINLLKLKPLMDYAKANRTPFVSNTTAYLISIKSMDDRILYYFRIRACIEMNNVKTGRGVLFQQ